MMRFIGSIGIAVIALGSYAQQPAPRYVCVDFEPPLAVGTIYGQPSGNLPGATVAMLNNVTVVAQLFSFGGGGSAFNRAEVATVPAALSTGQQALHLNNITLEFGFAQLNFQPSSVRFLYLDLGGIENLGVNGGAVFVGEFSTAPNPAPNISLTVTTTVTTPSPTGKRGSVEVKGPITSLAIGGQELWIDTVCAYQ
jgi:hypothetical protein